MSTVKYIEEMKLHFRIFKKESRRIPMGETGEYNAWGYRKPGQSMEGYGTKISSDWMCEINKRNYRVYITQISNCGSLWITFKGQKYFFHDYDFHDAK